MSVGLAVIMTIAVTGCGDDNPTEAQPKLTPITENASNSDKGIPSPNSQDLEGDETTTSDDTIMYDTDGESPALEQFDFSGNYEQDLNQVGYDLWDAEGNKNRNVDAFEENYCEVSLIDNVGVLDFGMRLQGFYKNDEADLARIIVNYTCPERSEHVENLLAQFANME